MDRRKRKEIAARLVEIATSYGAVAKAVEDQAIHRSIRVDAAFETINVSIDVDDLHGGGLLGCWYQATKPLSLAAPFNSVNEVHRHKATLYRSNVSMFYSAFRRACAAVADGSAFDETWVKPEMRTIPG
jgi:hypothetical protein